MRKYKNSKNRNSIGFNNFYFGKNVKIIVKPHAIDRIVLRELLNTNAVSNEDARRLIINKVKQSKLIDLKNGQEIRSHKGIIFACDRIYGKDKLGLLEEKLIIRTIMLSKVRMKEYFSTSFDMKKVDFEAMGFKNNRRVN